MRACAVCVRCVSCCVAVGRDWCYLDPAKHAAGMDVILQTLVFAGVPKMYPHPPKPSRFDAHDTHMAHAHDTHSSITNCSVAVIATTA
jgi:hypothetical protein